MLDILKHCVLCPRRCGADRTAGEVGFCRLSGRLVVDCALPHRGEEPPLSGRHGSGTIFFSSCNLRCVFCQNHQISHSAAGKTLTPAGLARIMLDLQDERCHNINAVTPTPQVPLIIEGLHLAREKGLAIPFVYNCGGYEDPQILRRLDGDVDIYLPDFKYGSDETAHLLSGVGDYVAFALGAVEEMARQVGEGLYLDDGIAVRGLLIRHLVLPGYVENSLAALELIRSRLSAEVTLSIMSQYTPIPAVKRHPLLGRRVSSEEYETVVDHALALGFENLYLQEVNNRHLSPDFKREEPFCWR
ncbi:MAG: radical SAM protein [Syntrophales bacterium]|nr:radical SAM protein [Syntrophales bacterium]